MDEEIEICSSAVDVSWISLLFVDVVMLAGEREGVEAQLSVLR